MRYNAGMAWDILAHDWAVQMLQQHITGGKMRHAYLFSGPSGVGRRTLALRFAQAVNCTQPPAPGYPLREMPYLQADRAHAAAGSDDRTVRRSRGSIEGGPGA